MGAAPRPSLHNTASSPALSAKSLVDWLSNPEAYAERPAEVRRIETHISCVFLTDRFAYKLKKPVRFDFLDFSTAELRRIACEEEVRLNRRLAPSLYLGLVAVCRDANGKYFLGENGKAADAGTIDWLVKMRRLPDDATLLARVQAKLATDADADAIARRLAEFYRHAAALPISPQAYRAEIEGHLRANRAELLDPQHGFDAAAVQRIHAAQLRLLTLNSELFDARVKAGRIVDGHGDLRPEHIYLLPGDSRAHGGPFEPAIIDCIEFNAEFRHLDIADELSFLATECDFAGAESLGQLIFERTSALLDDDPPPPLVAFYRSYRACVRAKVAALRSKQQTGEAQTQSLAEAQRRLQWAERYDRQLPAAFLIVVSGLMGSGKSTLAAHLGNKLGATIFSTDAIRRELFGPSQQPAEYGAGNYRPEDRLRVYDEMSRRAAKHLHDGLSVILDGAFLTTPLRSAARDIAAAANCPRAIVHCHCPAETALGRIAARRKAGKSVSEARPELFEHQRREEEPSASEFDSLEVDTTQSIDRQIELVLSNLATFYSPSAR
jgi:aminoglycoside phosphotransferase family enzyme/predicted kinase